MSSIHKLREYQTRVAEGKGLLAREWDHFDSLERQLDPSSFEKRRAAGAKHVAIEYAKKLSIDDLESIINEKRFEEKARKMREADAKDL